MKLSMRIYCFLMAVSFFMATTGFSVYEHYCGNNLVDTSLYSSDSSCQPEHAEDTCSSAEKMDCCKNQFEYFQLDTELKNQDLNRKVIDLTAISYFYLPYLQENWEKANNLIPRIDSEAPLIFGAEPIYILQQQLVYYG